MNTAMPPLPGPDEEAERARQLVQDPEPDPRALASWRQELVRIVLLGALGVVLGLGFGEPAAGLALILMIYGSLQLRQLAALRRWLQSPKRYELPDAGGIWGEVFDRLLDLQRKNRKKKKRLAAMLAEFQASTAALPDGAVVLGERGEIAWFNQAARTLLALRTPQDIGLRIVNLVRSPSFTEYFASGDYEREIETASPVNRSKTLSLRIIPYGNNQKLLIVRDVSELKRLETARRDFVANASHELRTPLTVLRGYLEMMEPEAGQGPLAPWRAPLMEMRSQAQRMEALVADMLRLARMESDAAHMKDEMLDVPVLLRRAVDEARALSQGTHRFELKLQAGLGLIGGESELLSIATNLLSNAVRYTPPGGVIRVGWEESAEGAALSVADTGIGIAADDLPRLTERFYRVDVGRSRGSGGTGLGLSIVKHALERWDARMRIDSELGVGSTFSCHFPLHRVHRLLPVPAGERSPQGAGQR